MVGLLSFIEETMWTQTVLDILGQIMRSGHRDWKTEVSRQMIGDIHTIAFKQDCYAMKVEFEELKILTINNRPCQLLKQKLVRSADVLAIKEKLQASLICCIIWSYSCVRK